MQRKSFANHTEDLDVSRPAGVGGNGWSVLDSFELLQERLYP